MIKDSPPIGAIIPKKEYLEMEIKYKVPENNTIPITNK